MSSTRITSIVTFLVCSTGLSLLVLGGSTVQVITGAALVTGGAIYLTRHLWREAGLKSDRGSIAHARRLGDEVSKLSAELKAVSSSLSSQTEEVSDRVTAFSHGVLEYVSQLQLDVAALASIPDEIKKGLELNDHRAQRYRDEVLAQLSAVVGVYEILQPRVPYPRFGGWAIDGDCARQLVSKILTDRPQWILEMGSGLSTILAAQAMDREGLKGQVISLEHDEYWAEQTRKLVDAHGVSERCRIVHAPLVETKLDGQIFEWYDLSEAELPDQIQLIFVDGPPKATGPRARYPALPMLYDRLGEGGIVLLDDAARPEEREAIDLWAEKYPSLSVSITSGSKGVAEITKGRE